MLCWKGGPTKEKTRTMSCIENECTNVSEADMLTLFVHGGYIIFTPFSATAIEALCKSESFA